MPQTLILWLCEPNWCWGNRGREKLLYTTEGTLQGDDFFVFPFLFFFFVPLLSHFVRFFCFSFFNLPLGTFSFVLLGGRELDCVSPAPD